MTKRKHDKQRLGKERPKKNGQCRKRRKRKSWRKLKNDNNNSCHARSEKTAL